jgi:hypothetical protein
VRQVSRALEGVAFGVDFNPVPDALRITSDADQNLRQPFANENPTAEDGRLAYAAGDPGAGSNPVVAGSAYTNSVPGATTTTLFNIDTARDALVRQDPPNSGTLNTVGPLGIDVSEVLGFDIAANQIAYASVVRAGSARSDLVRIDLARAGRRTPRPPRRSTHPRAATPSGRSGRSPRPDRSRRPPRADAVGGLLEHDPRAEHPHARAVGQLRRVL